MTSAPRRFAAVARRMVPAVVFLGVAGYGVVVGDRIEPFGRSLAVGAIVMISAVVALLLTVTTRAERLLVVERSGMRIGSAAVPWSSIRQVVVAPGAGTGDVEVGLRLRPAAPLPEGVRAVLFDPARPRAVQIRQVLPARRVDPHRLLATARALAPPSVATVMEATPVPDPHPLPAGRNEVVGTVTAVRLRSTGRVFLRTPSMHGSDYRHRFTPYPVVRFHLPDGRHVLAETSSPGGGEPGDRVVVTADAADPTAARVRGPAPRARWMRTA
jgi:hypothetical protein